MRREILKVVGLVLLAAGLLAASWKQQGENLWIAEGSLSVSLDDGVVIRNIGGIKLTLRVRGKQQFRIRERYYYSDGYQWNYGRFVPVRYYYYYFAEHVLPEIEIKVEYADSSAYFVITPYQARRWTGAGYDFSDKIVLKREMLSQTGKVKVDAGLVARYVYSYKVGPYLEKAVGTSTYYLTSYYYKCNLSFKFSKSYIYYQEYLDAYRRGLLYLKSGDFQKAEEEFKKALEYKPLDEKAMEKLAEARTERQNRELVKKKRKQRLESYLRKAAQMEAAERWDEAIKAYEQALLLDPGNRQILARLDEAKYRKYYSLGLSMQRKGRLKQALEYFRKALRYRPGDRQLREKIASLEASLKIGEASKLINRAEELKLAGMWDEAISLLQQALQLDPQSEELKKRLKRTKFEKFYFLGLKYEKEGKLEKALIAYREALNYQPGDRKVEEAIAKLEQRLKEEGQKKQRFSSLFSKARFFYQQGQYKEALAAAKAALSLFPESEQVRKLYDQIASHYRRLLISTAEDALEQGDLKAAEQALKLLKENFPDDEKIKLLQERFLQQKRASLKVNRNPLLLVLFLLAIFAAGVFFYNLGRYLSERKGVAEEFPPASEVLELKAEELQEEIKRLRGMGLRRARITIKRAGYSTNIIYGEGE